MKIPLTSLLVLCSGASQGRVTPRAIISLLLLYLAKIVSADGVSSSIGIGDQLQGGSEANNGEFFKKYQDIKVEDFEAGCPHVNDTLPCTCGPYGGSDIMEINCSDIESEEQLRQVFEAHFPVKNLGSFTMYWNTKLKVLEAGVFGDVTFETFSVWHNAIEEIETGFFDSLYETVTILDIGYNNLTDFHFWDIPKFSHLSKIDISGNNFESIPLKVFHNSTSLTEITLMGHTGSFAGNFHNMPNIERIYLAVNELTTIPEKFLKTGSNNLTTISLNNGSISLIEPHAFDPLEGLQILMFANSLTTLEETTWRPLFNAGVMVEVRSNPFECDCSMAWLFGDDYLLDQVIDHYGGGRPTCRNGEPLHDLDPAIFDNC